jgi:hypothetical protein
LRESQWSASDNTGTAMLFEAASARVGRLSSASRLENAKELWRPPKPKAKALWRRRKSDLSEQADRFI